MKTIERVTWEYEYSVGVVEIDNQHKELMNLVNDLINHSTDEKNERKPYLLKAVETASSHLAKHFDTEERVLGKTDYEKMAEHKKEHENLVAKVKAVKNELGNNNEDTVMYNLSITMKEYFLSHILLYDKEAGKYFKTGSEIIAASGFQEGII